MDTYYVLKYLHRANVTAVRISLYERTDLYRDGEAPCFKPMNTPDEHSVEFWNSLVLPFTIADTTTSDLRDNKTVQFDYVAPTTLPACNNTGILFKVLHHPLPS